MMKFVLALCAAVLTGAPDAGSTGPSARSELKDSQGRPVGEVTLTQTPSGLLISAALRGLPPGAHAFHIHQVGRCDPPDFTSAGGHFNPSRHQHGFQNPQGAHAGDLPNVFIPASGEAKVEILNGTGARLDQLLTPGASLVLHATGDDYHTDPAGAAGGRIACGPIVAR